MADTHPSGFEVGTVLTSPNGDEEKIVDTLDEDGNVVGWHKEPVKATKKKGS